MLTADPCAIVPLCAYVDLFQMGCLEANSISRHSTNLFFVFFVFLNSAVVWQEVSNNLILANRSCSRHNVKAECVQSARRSAEALGALQTCVCSAGRGVRALPGGLMFCRCPGLIETS